MVDTRNNLGLVIELRLATVTVCNNNYDYEYEHTVFLQYVVVWHLSL